MEPALRELLTSEIPPHSLEAERAVLGAILLERESLPKAVEILKPADFYKEGHRRIFEAIIALFGRGEPVDLVTLREELRRRSELEEVGGEVALATLVEEGAVAVNLPTHAGIVKEKSTRRELIRLGTEITHMGYKAQQDPKVLVQTALDSLNMLGRNGASHPAWPLYDAAEDWDFPPTQYLIEGLFPLKGVTWVGGLPKRFKSLFMVYICLALASRQPEAAGHFKIRAYPKILYVAREDGGSRIQDRRKDILATWRVCPHLGAIRFVIRPHIDLLSPAHVDWLRKTCLQEGITLVVLDTWTALSPTADPLAAKDQAALASVVARLAEDIDGQVIVVDHSRKNRPDGQPLSSADIFGPPQKWAAAEHIVMLDVTGDRRRLEVFVESKDMESDRFFLTVSPPASGEEKFRYAGTVAEIAEAQRAAGDRNRQAILEILQESPEPLSTANLVAALQQRGVVLKSDTVQRHCKVLVTTKKVQVAGSGRTTKYFALNLASDSPSSENGLTIED